MTDRRRSGCPPPSCTDASGARGIGRRDVPWVEIQSGTASSRATWRGCQHGGGGVEPPHGRRGGVPARGSRRASRCHTQTSCAPAASSTAPSGTIATTMVHDGSPTPAQGRHTPRRHSRSGEGVAPPAARRSPPPGRRRRLCGPARSGGHRSPVEPVGHGPTAEDASPATRRIRSSRPSDRPPRASRTSPGRHREPRRAVRERRGEKLPAATGTPETTATAANRPPEPPGRRGARSARPSPGRGRRRRLSVRGRRALASTRAASIHGTASPAPLTGR